MTPREIILANINHTGAERPGMTFSNGRVHDMIGCDIGPSRSYKPRRWTEGGMEYYDDEWGNLWVRMVGRSVKGEVHTPVLPSWDRLDDLELPDYKDAGRYEKMSEVFAPPTDKFRIAYIGGWIFDNARYLRKMEVYFLDMAMYPEELKVLHAKVAEVYEAKIHGAGRAGADGIMIGEDMGTQSGLLFSPAMFTMFFKDEYRRLIGIAHEYGMKVLMHSCGMNWEIIDDLIDCGVDCFQFDQPALYDMPALAAKFRERRVALWSPTDIQKVLPTGDRTLIEAETRRMLDTFEGCLITKDYPDLHGIGVDPEWDMWAYNVVAERAGIARAVTRGARE